MGKEYEDYMVEIIKNTKTASEQWSEFAMECEDIASFKKVFHLRPTCNSVTIVSTFEKKPMRGIKKGRTVVKKHLETIYRIYASAVNEDKLNTELEDLGFQNRKKPKDEKNEEIIQAKMIREMTDNQNLKDFLEVDELIFIASEFILHPSTDKKPRERIDIIAYDGKNKIFFFELKTPDNKRDDPIGQLKNYLKKYGGHKKQETLSVLSNYPINCIKNGNKEIEFEGYAIFDYDNEVDLINSKRATSYMETRSTEKVYYPGTIKFIRN